MSKILGRKENSKVLSQEIREANPGEIRKKKKQRKPIRENEARRQARASYVGQLICWVILNKEGPMDQLVGF